VNLKILRTHLGQEIRERRLSRGFSQEELASMAAMHVNLLGRIERGTANPTFLKLFGIAKCLEVTLPQLMMAAERKYAK
jgi:transcriptional regulator with XRE-family HTH domain